MNIISFILIQLFAYGGLFVGVWLGINSPEELTPGKKYFLMLQKFCILLIIGSLLILSYINSQWYLLILALVAIIVYSVLKKFPEKKTILLLLPFTGILNIGFLILLFLYGLPTGTLEVQPFTKEKKITKSKIFLYSQMFKKTYYFFIALVCSAVIFYILHK